MMKYTRTFGRLGTGLVLAAGLLLGATLGGCGEGKLGEAERAEILRVIRTGTELPDDPYVRLETLRVLELVADPALNEFVEPRLSDPSPGVRVAALRVLLATRHPRARQHTMAIFNDADDREKLAIVNSVLELGGPTLQRAVLDRAVRATDPMLRLVAFERGVLARFEAAVAAGDDDALRRTLIPELGTFVAHDDEHIAALALRHLVEAGEANRATPLIERFADSAEPVERRLAAARVLTRARIALAREAFTDLVEDFDAPIEAASRSGVARRRPDARLLRAAVLGLVASGDAERVPRAQEFLKDTTADEAIEVLEALAPNPSAEAAVSLRIAMRDARTLVRRRAIQLYAERSDARADALIGALRHDDFETQKMLASILSTERFVEEWSAHLRGRLQNETLLDPTLALLRNVLRTDAELAALRPVEDLLAELVNGPDEERAAIAAYLLVQISAAPDPRALIERPLDTATRYAYLERLAEGEARAHVDVFRRHLRADQFGIRLMSSAGLWRAFATTPLPADADLEPAADDDEPRAAK